MFEFRGQGWIGNGKAAFSPNADGGLGAERSLVAHLLSRGHAELVGCCRVAAPARQGAGWVSDTAPCKAVGLRVPDVPQPTEPDGPFITREAAVYHLSRF